ncbi:hypothetical protein BRX37_23890 [Sphingomonas sp. S-NIH.Pt3_0716]|nr:hypothetical protein BRX37_23890 [Sphingomonas sp. S-NIH.Pt3_0716]
MTAIDTITDLIRERGAEISRADLAEIERLVVDIPIDDLPDVYPWIFESITLTVSDPLYQGDIEMSDLD